MQRARSDNICEGIGPPQACLSTIRHMCRCAGALQVPPYSSGGAAALQGGGSARRRPRLWRQGDYAALFKVSHFKPQTCT